ncbi:Arc family DNA-binding protein [Paracoccus sp. IB05]|uniref:Arc family DNA-binding protein n=1 Tax=Paracoccus sp. IB05 TaxID=2779367 RepID=UPI0018E90262|nr:Arc family DNA-binding protein [Paracoccus sp. IB05]MBJ2151571.1 Arc family DNA-binding protein [Paracoccus sp. IB05]
MSEDTQVKIRLPLALKEVIEAAAKAQNRSMTGEIIAKLEEAFGMASSTAPGVVRRAMKSGGPAVSEGRLDDVEKRLKVLEAFIDGLGVIGISDDETGERHLAYVAPGAKPRA